MQDILTVAAVVVVAHVPVRLWELTVKVLFKQRRFEWITTIGQRFLTAKRVEDGL